MRGIEAATASTLSADIELRTSRNGQTRLPFEIVRRWRRWRSRENEIMALENELALYPHHAALKVEIDRQKRMRACHQVPNGFSSWGEIEAKLRASGQF